LRHRRHRYVLFLGLGWHDADVFALIGF
jgi:hypothetical protein